MVSLTHQIELVIEPVPPYDYHLTVRKPAGWNVFTPFEVYRNDTLWTATHLDGSLTGIKLTSSGAVMRPELTAALFLDEEPGTRRRKELERSLVHCLGADEDLSAFYAFAAQDDLLDQAVRDHYGMHDTSATTIFPSAVLAISLQMTNFKRSEGMMNCLITNYGEVAEFDGAKVHAWPTERRMAEVDAETLAKVCKYGYRAKFIAQLSRRMSAEPTPTVEELERMPPEQAKRYLLGLPGIGEYSADIIDPHGGFPIDVWSADVFGKLFFGREPQDKSKAIEAIRREGERRWGRWSWLAFLYIVQDLPNLARRMGVPLRDVDPLSVW